MKKLQSQVEPQTANFPIYWYGCWGTPHTISLCLCNQAQLITDAKVQNYI